VEQLKVVEFNWLTKRENNSPYGLKVVFYSYKVNDEICHKKLWILEGENLKLFMHNYDKKLRMIPFKWNYDENYI
jgi:hypothetical protein